MEPSERSPLLSEQDDGNPAQQRFVVTSEAPPSYAAAGGGAVIITCRVCENAVPVEGKLHHNVVKCSRCSEATPIRNAPPGKKYVRCSCNCLLVCKVTSLKISCPRPLCKRVIHLEPLRSSWAGPQQQQQPPPPFGVQIICGKCNNTFLWTLGISEQTLVKCPHCHKTSALGWLYPRIRCLCSFLISLVFVAIIGAVMGGTWHSIKNVPVVCVGGVMLAMTLLFLLLSTLYWGRMKVSRLVTDGE